MIKTAQDMKSYKKQLKEALADKFLRTALDNFNTAYRENRPAVYDGIDFEGIRDEIAAGKDGALPGLVRLFETFKRHAEAAGELEAALRKSSPEDTRFAWAPAALELSRIYLRDLDDPDAADPWIRAAADHPDHEADSRELMLELLERQGNWSALTTELEHALVANPTADSVIALTRARLQTGDFETALSTLQTARRRFPDRLDLVHCFTQQMVE